MRKRLGESQKVDQILEIVWERVKKLVKQVKQF